MSVAGSVETGQTVDFLATLRLNHCLLVPSLFNIWRTKKSPGRNHAIVPRVVEQTNLKVQLLGLFPGKGLIGEVAVLCGSAVDGVDQVEFLDNNTRSQIEVLVDDFD